MIIPAIERRTAAADTGGRLIDSRVRLRRLAILFAGLLLAIVARLAWLEQTEGPKFRELAAKPIERRRWVDGVRGRILSRDGIVLAEDRPVSSVAVDYRWLVDPPDDAWLRRAARQRLARRELPQQMRRDPTRIADEIESICNERQALHDRLALICGVEPHAWKIRLSTVQKQVTDLADRVNARRQEKFLAAVRKTSASKNDSPDAWSRFRAVAMSILFPADLPVPPAESSSPRRSTIRLWSRGSHSTSLPRSRLTLICIPAPESYNNRGEPIPLAIGRLTLSDTWAPCLPRNSPPHVPVDLPIA